MFSDLARHPQPDELVQDGAVGHVACVLLHQESE
jgi:hypothetical protein